MIRTIKLSDSDSQKVIDTALACLRRGGVVVFPSDTAYGLLADATNLQAVKTLTRFKDRPAGKPISVFVSDWKMLRELVKVDASQEATLRRLLPGPFTVILPSRRRVVSAIESQTGSLGVRLIRFPLINRLVKQYGQPLTATSANLSGSAPRYRIDTFVRRLSGKKQALIGLVVDAGPLPRRRPSTVIDLTGEKLQIIRQGDWQPASSKTYLSRSPGATKAIAKKLVDPFLARSSTGPVVFLVSGALGAGKTVFAQGVGEAVGVDNVVSPTFTVAYEYPVRHPLISRLIHFDLYHVRHHDELEHLGIKAALQPHHLLVFEWGEKGGDLLSVFQKQNSRLVYVEIQYVDGVTRKLSVSCRL
ncbi:MAG: L-threonylcarbamoyladenylate synthase [Patescibacteria group bacterium]|nr:L-threonylcarbamoyladenylate synthase [Patescibacteria group bacterium]